MNNVEMQVRISARLRVLRNLAQEKNESEIVTKIDEELAWLSSLSGELTWEDIRLIVQLNEDVMAEAGGTPKDFCEEVLRRFNEKKG